MKKIATQTQDNSTDNVDLHAKIAELEKEVFALRMQKGRLEKEIERLKDKQTNKEETIKENSKKHIMLSTVIHDGITYERGMEIKANHLVELFLEKGFIS